MRDKINKYLIFHAFFLQSKLSIIAHLVADDSRKHEKYTYVK